MTENVIDNDADVVNKACHAVLNAYSQREIGDTVQTIPERNDHSKDFENIYFPCLQLLDQLSSCLNNPSQSEREKIAPESFAEDVVRIVCQCPRGVSWILSEALLPPALQTIIDVCFRLAEATVATPCSFPSEVLLRMGRSDILSARYGSLRFDEKNPYGYRDQVSAKKVLSNGNDNFDIDGMKALRDRARIRFPEDERLEEVPQEHNASFISIGSNVMIFCLGHKDSKFIVSLSDQDGPLFGGVRRRISKKSSNQTFTYFT